MHTLRHFSAEAFESITHADSRLWRTIFALIAKPGELTREFFAGRRARYLPPVRLYLVVSVMFFFFAGLASRNSSDIVKIDVQTNSTAVAGTSQSDRNCTNIEYDGPFHEWLLPRLQHQCDAIVADGGKGLWQSVLRNIPKALFVLLPLLAALMMLLYWRPRHYYVEHLLFLLNNHTNLFVSYSLLLLLGLWLPDSPIVGLLGVALHIWILWYIYRSMRVFYKQSRSRTWGKFAAMLLIYVTAAGITMVVTMLISAITL